MEVGRNPSAVVLDLDRAVAEQGDDDVAAESGERFVDGVVDNLEDHVMQS